VDKSTLIEILGQAASEEAGEQLRQFLRGVVRSAVVDVMAEEVLSLCGPSHVQGQRGQARFARGGSAVGVCVIEGRTESIRRPRVREQIGGQTREKVLDSYEGFQNTEAVREQILRCFTAGVATREMKAVLPGSPGTSRSEVSRQWQQHGRKCLDALRERDLGGHPYVVLILDGIVLAEDLHAVAALGVTADGTKQFLDFEIGVSESFETCDALMVRLRERGFGPSPGVRLLVLEDGSAAIRKASLKHWPDAVIQRCLVHKERNLRRHLSRKHHAELGRLFNCLRKAQGIEAGLDAYRALERFVATKNQAAQESLREAGEDLLAVHRLNLPSTLNVSLLSTNAIENSFRNVRAGTDRVKRWGTKTDQASYWLGWALQKAERGFRRIRGHQSMAALVAALSHPLG